LLTPLEVDLQTHLPCLQQQAGLVLEAERAGEIGERALEKWRPGAAARAGGGGEVAVCKEQHVGA
jgi:hypothetical protein